ncbi:MAG: hypothetical protein FD175_2692 [Beijerinckiaceae bacterium]|nr:MAG: hypothetical protein FD175_2692 [Beijerinckiaceae bacterium]
MMRDHGGNLDMAVARFGAGSWIDLSTGINPIPYPVPAISSTTWTGLPTQTEIGRLMAAALRCYASEADIAPLPGAQAAIQLLPRLILPGCARVLSPTYNEHAASLAAAGWTVEPVATPEALRGADLAVVVNPNNPDGRTLSLPTLLDLSHDVGLLIVDESFADATPEVSLAPQAGRKNLIILRSFGKFYGLAGLRLGFALGSPEIIASLRELAGPWPVSGPAIEIGTAALSDTNWQEATRARLALEADLLDALALAAGWQCVGGTSLFRLFAVPDAITAQEALARHHIWSRIFPFSRHWIRLGIPGCAPEWTRLAEALKPVSPPRGES